MYTQVKVAQRSNLQQWWQYG